MHAFSEHPNNDYTDPPLMNWNTAVKMSLMDHMQYATADQVVQREKRMQGHQEANDGRFKQSTFDTESNRSSNSDTYVS